MEKMILPGGWDNQSIPPLPNRRDNNAPMPTLPKKTGRRMKKRKTGAVILVVAMLTLVLTGGSALALFKFNPALLGNALHNDGQKDRHNVQYSRSSTTMNNSYQDVTTINSLNKISVVGSTAFIVDGHGKTIAADPNPYGIAIAPRDMADGGLRPGDVLVTNFGAMNTGTTLVRFPAGKGPGLLFNTTANPGTKGPAFEAFNPATGSDWVANFSANNIQVFRADGALKVTITSPFFKMPWAMASNNGMRNALDGAIGSFFTTNTGDATIDRIDVIPSGKGTAFRVFQIGQLTKINGGAKINATWVPSLKIGGKRFSDVLLVLDLANNRVAAYPNSTTMNTSMTRSTYKGITAFQGKPLNTPVGLTINPLNGDLLVVNGNDNNLVELNLSQGKAVGVKQLDNVPVDAQSGNGSALFGVAAAVDSRGYLKVFFTDDNMNTLNMLSW